VIHFEKQTKVECIKEESVKGKNVSVVEQKTLDDGNAQKLADETIDDDVHSHSI
jgi:hypothetical protein